MPFAKGQSGNPAGRPKEAKLIRDALTLAAKRVCETDPDGRIMLAVAAEKVVEAATKGDLLAFKEMADRIDGKPRQELEHETGEQMSEMLIGWLGERLKLKKANGHANGHANGSADPVHSKDTV